MCRHGSSLGAMSAPIIEIVRTFIIGLIGIFFHYLFILRTASFYVIIRSHSHLKEENHAKKRNC